MPYDIFKNIILNARNGRTGKTRLVQLHVEKESEQKYENVKVLRTKFAMVPKLSQRYAKEEVVLFFQVGDPGLIVLLTVEVVKNIGKELVQIDIKTTNYNVLMALKIKKYLVLQLNVKKSGQVGLNGPNARQLVEQKLSDSGRERVYGKN